MTRRNTLNNMQLDNIRRTKEYQAVITDLAMAGVVPVATAEMLLGYEIPDFLHTPDGKGIASGDGGASEKKQAYKKKESAQAELPIAESKE